MSYASLLSTDLGFMKAWASDAGLTHLDWQQTAYPSAVTQNDVSRETIKQLQAYLAGKLTAFSLPLDISAQSTSLQSWLAILQTISYGQIMTYSELAEKWGNRSAARAAGSACQKNPLPIIIPCHRVTQSDGGYDHYSGGDRSHPRDPENIKRKQYLIALETGGKA